MPVESTNPILIWVRAAQAVLLIGQIGRLVEFWQSKIKTFFVSTKCEAKRAF